MKLEALERLLAPMKARVAMLVARALVERVNDGLKLQGLQISMLKGETRDEVERFQNYGFTSVPKPGAEAVALSAGGNRDHVLVIAVDDRRYRLKALAEGEVAVYDDLGKTLIFKRDGKIEVRAPQFDFVATGPVVIKGATVSIEATGGSVTVQASQAVNVNGALAAVVSAPVVAVSGSSRVDVDGPIVDLQDKGDYKGHIHSGVQVGGNNSGAVV